MKNPKDYHPDRFSTKAWKVKRTKTCVGFIIENICLGMEYSLTFSTLWLYLEDLIKTEEKRFFYSLVSSVFIISQVAGAMIFGKITDKYRNVRMMFTFANALIIIGNVLYVVPFTPWFLVAGRSLSGFGAGVRVVTTSELARSFPREMLSSIFSLIGMTNGLGFVLGPVINFPFLKMDIWLYNVHVTYANVPGLYLAAIFALVQICNCFLIHDLSKEYDLKASQTDKNNEKEVLIDENRTQLKQNCTDTSITSISKQIFLHIDIVLILLLSFGFMYSVVLFNLWQSMVIVKLLHWGPLEINIILLVNGISEFLLFMLLLKFPLNGMSMVYTSWLCALSLTGINLMLIAFKLYNLSLFLNITMWTLYSIFFAIVIIMEEIFLIGTLAKMSETGVQAFAESIRLVFSRIGALIALLTASITFQDIEYECAVLAILSGLAFCLLIWRRKSFQSPIVIISDNK